MSLHRIFEVQQGLYIKDSIYRGNGLHFALYCFVGNGPVSAGDRLGLIATGVKSCVRYYESGIWHAYLQVGDWTMGWAGEPYSENFQDQHARGCCDMERREEGKMPDGKSCKCATPAELQKCVMDESNWPRGSYSPLWGRNCGTWVKEVAKRCCMKAKFRAPWFDPHAGGAGNIGGPIIYGPSFGWEFPPKDN